MITRYIQTIKDFFKRFFGALKTKKRIPYHKAFIFAKYLLRTGPRTKPEKIWCFYADPYRKGFAVTGLTFSGVMAIIAIVFLIVGLITLGLFFIAIILYSIAGVALIGLGLSGLKGFEGGFGPGVGATLITGSIAYYLWQPVIGFIDGFWSFASGFSENLNYITYVTGFLSVYWPWLLGVIVTPAIVVLIIAIFTIIAVYTLRCVEQIALWIYGIRYPCPECAQKTEPAIYFCKTCGEMHPHNLVPSQYGIFAHQCVNGHQLPTMLLLGRNKEMPHRCPHPGCETDLSSGAVGTDKHIAFVGGQTSGKTCLLVQVTRQLLIKGANIPEPDQKRDFMMLKDRMEKGQAPDKTSPQNVYRAFQMTIKKGAFPYHIHFYDLAGEKFEHAQDAAGHRFFTTLDGIVFAFDPFSIPEFRNSQRLPLGLGVATQDPLEIIRNLSQVLARYNDKAKIKKIVLNILLVKSDIGYLDSFVSLVLEQKQLNEKIKLFMKEELGQAAFIHHIEQHFEKINYFYVSALGRIPLPNDNSPFVALNLNESFDKIWKEIKVKIH